MRALLAVVRTAPLLRGFCYTQFADTYQETNGLLYADRSPKIAIAEIAAAIRGPQSPGEEELARRQAQADAARDGEGERETREEH